jgi:heptaprenyl diphosphate synthase
VNIGELLSLPELRNDLVRVDRALLDTVQAGDPFLTEVASHLISAGGKRLRPSMAIAAALTCTYAPVADAVIQGAAAVELVHLGSLYHDDVLDAAETRRTVSSVNARWGNFMAIIAGDYLLARASSIAARLGTEVTALLAETIAALCEGQVTEQQKVFDITRTVEEYETSISGKTASLIAAAARIGALTGQLGADEVTAVTDYAHAFGMAFQIRDDVLDVTGTDEELGKPAGNDLVEGVYTLPVIYALADEASGPELADLLGGPIEVPERDKAREIIRNSDGVTRAIATGRQWADRATEALGRLDNSPMAGHLVELAAGLFD